MPYASEIRERERGEEEKSRGTASLDAIGVLGEKKAIPMESDGPLP